MIPTVGLLTLGTTRWWVPVPLPVFLVWPFVLVVLGTLAVGKQLARGKTALRITTAYIALRTFCQLSGLDVSLQTVDDFRMRLRLL